jgi:hypothetical protein
MSQAECRIMFALRGFDAAIEVHDVAVSDVATTLLLVAEELETIGASGRSYPKPKPVPVEVVPAKLTTATGAPASVAPHRANGKPVVAAAPGGEWKEIDGVRVIFDEKRKLWVRESKLAAWCEVHHCWMERRQNSRGAWYSHYTGDGWCNGKKVKAA